VDGAGGDVVGVLVALLSPGAGRDAELTRTANCRILELMEKVIPTARLEARLPAEVHALLKRAAEMQGRTLTDFVVTAARDAAFRALGEAEIIRLSLEDQRLIATALLNPPKPTPALRRAFKRHRQLFGPA
jgi:uncharacterized protein (DUF1778 family)